MSFAPAITVPTLTRGDLDEVNEQFRSLSKELRTFHSRWRERYAMYGLTGAQFMVLCAIVSRTLGWSKVVEVIPLSVFTDGVQKSGKISEVDHMPVFAGTKLDKKTIRSALAFLDGAGLITRFAFPSGGRETFAYMPFSAWTLREILAKRPNHGTLPDVVTAALRYSADGGEVRSGYEVHFASAFTRTAADLDEWVSDLASGNFSPGRVEFLPRSGGIAPPVPVVFAPPLNYRTKPWI